MGKEIVQLDPQKIRNCIAKVQDCLAKYSNDEILDYVKISGLKPSEFYQNNDFINRNSYGPLLPALNSIENYTISGYSDMINKVKNNLAKLDADMIKIIETNQNQLGDISSKEESEINGLGDLEVDEKNKIIDENLIKKIKELADTIVDKKLYNIINDLLSKLKTMNNAGIIDVATCNKILNLLMMSLELLKSKKISIDSLNKIISMINNMLNCLEGKNIDISSINKIVDLVNNALTLLNANKINIDNLNNIVDIIINSLKSLEEKNIDVSGINNLIDLIQKTLTLLEANKIDLSTLNSIIETIFGITKSLNSANIDANSFKILIDKIGELVDSLEESKVDLAVFLVILSQIKKLIDGTLLDITKKTFIIKSLDINMNDGSMILIIKINGKYYRIYIENGEIVKMEEIKKYYSKENELFIDYEKKMLIIYKEISIVLPDGTILTLKPGQYKIISYIFDNGNTIVVIEYNGDKYKLYFDSNGNVFKAEKYVDITGVLTIKDNNQLTYNSEGEETGTIKAGNYYTYETKTNDSNGDVEKIRISPNTENDVWINYDENNKQVDYSQFTNNQKNNNGTSISLFDKNKALLGAIGVLFVGGGAFIAAKKIKSKKDKNQEEILTEGNYAIYDVKSDDNGLITEARISTDDADEEYWVEM